MGFLGQKITICNLTVKIENLIMELFFQHYLVKHANSHHPKIQLCTSPSDLEDTRRQCNLYYSQMAKLAAQFQVMIQIPN